MVSLHDETGTELQLEFHVLALGLAARPHGCHISAHRYGGSKETDVVQLTAKKGITK